MEGEKSDLNCEFNAPMFVDFTSLDAQVEDGNPEAYFEVNHEDIPMDAEEAPEASKMSSRTKNIVTSWDDVFGVVRQDTPTRKVLRKEVSKTIKEITNSPKVKVPEKRTNKPDYTGPKSPLKRLNPGRQLPAGKPRPTTTAVTSKPVVKEHSVAASPALSKWRKAIKQMTPEIMRQARSRKIKKERGESGIQNPKTGVGIKAQLAKSRTAKPSTSSVFSTKATEPVPFKFATSQRIHNTAQPVKGNEDVDFTKMLRSYQQHNTNKGTPVCTKVQPFNLSSGTKYRSHSATRTTPVAAPRSTANPRRRFRSASPTPSPWRPTQPQTPNLVTRGRARPDPNILSHDQKEELEVRGRKPFRAHPVKIPAKAVGVPAANRKGPIVPESPAFMLKHRMEERRKREGEQVEKEPEAKRIPYAKPVPQFGVPVILPNSSKKATKMTPFSFDSRDIATQEKKEQKIQAMLEEERKLREFKANPIPDRTRHTVAPPVPPREATRLEPFELQIEKRVGDRLTKWEQSVQEDLKKQRHAANFKATPAAILEREPFMPKPCDKAPVFADEVQLHSDRRAADRLNFDKHIKQREAEQDAIKMQRHQAEENERHKEIKKLRQEAVHKAQPVKHYKPIHILPSDRPITAPHSPNFTYKNKTKN